MRVRWTPEAVQDRLAIWDYLVERNPGAAARMDTLFSKAAERLAAHPELAALATWMREHDEKGEQEGLFG